MLAGLKLLRSPETAFALLARMDADDYDEDEEGEVVGLADLKCAVVVLRRKSKG